jgi:hypothetical protein
LSTAFAAMATARPALAGRTLSYSRMGTTKPRGVGKALGGVMEVWMTNTKMQRGSPRSNGRQNEAERGKLSMAVRYAEAGIAVVPLHGTDGGRCTCDDPKCAQPGKHPRTEHGICASADTQSVRRLWKKWPHAKIAIAFGGPSKLLGLEIHGGTGRKSLRALTERNGKLLRTVTIRDWDTWVRLFRHNDAGAAGRALGEGLRLLGDGDFMIAPSYLEPTSFETVQFRPDRRLERVKIAPAPKWLFESTAKDISRERVTSIQTPVAVPTVVLQPTSEIEPEPVTWIWPGVIASGRVTSVVGHPGLGKSQVSVDIAATISTGRAWPGGAANESAGHVLILSAEDDAADTIVPRLIAAAADRAAVHLVKAVKGHDGVERAFTLADDLEQLEQEYDLQQVRLLIVDPITAYLGEKNGAINRNHGSEVRPLLDRLTAFAERHDLAVLAISHLNKSGGAKAITRIMGSLDFVAVARAVYLVTEEPGSARRLFLPVKNNLAPDRIGYAFDLEGKIVGEGVQTSAVKWSDDAVTISSDEALAAAGKRASSGAIDFLREVLSDGPMEQAEIVRRGEEAGFSTKSLRTAREKLGVTSKREGGLGAAGQWVWHPPGGAKVLKLVVNNDSRRRKRRMKT